MFWLISLIGELAAETGDEDTIVERIIASKSPLKLTVDLGCGEGKRWLKSYSRYIVGVDHREQDLIIASKRGYNKVLKMDFRDYQIPDECDSVLMIQSIEHIPKQDGLKILKQIGNRFCVITTPSTWFPIAYNHHQSLWFKEDFGQFGFNTAEITFGRVIKRPKIIACRL